MQCKRALFPSCLAGRCIISSVDANNIALVRKLTHAVNSIAGIPGIASTRVTPDVIRASGVHVADFGHRSTFIHVDAQVARLYVTIVARTSIRADSVNTCAVGRTVEQRRIVTLVHICGLIKVQMSYVNNALYQLAVVFQLRITKQFMILRRRKRFSIEYLRTIFHPR